MGPITVRGDVRTLGGEGMSLVKGVQTHLRTTAISIKPGGDLPAIHVGGRVETVGANLTAVEVHEGTHVGEFRIDDGVHAPGPGSRAVQVDGVAPGLDRVEFHEDANPTVAVIGTGRIGRRVAARLAANGVRVLVAGSSRDKGEEVALEIGHGVKALSTHDAVVAADIVILATMFASSVQILTDEADTLIGKILVDPSNNIGPGPDGDLVDLNPEHLSAGNSSARSYPTGSDT